MALWTDLIDPATLTGYVRQAQEDYETSKGTLAQFLPNRTVPNIDVKFVKGATGLIDVAEFRAYDAEPEVGAGPAAKRVTLELPALGQQIPASEYNQLRAAGDATDETLLGQLLVTATRVARASSDAMERQRGTVLATGRATIPRIGLDEDFGRPAAMQLVATNLWSASTATSRLDYIRQLCDIYRDQTGEDPGCILLSQAIFTSLAAGVEFQTQLLNGGARNATIAQVNDTVTGAGLPPIVKYDRKVGVNGVATRVTPADTLMLLPAPVAPDDFLGTDLGATFWGRTLTSMDPSYGIQAGSEPGIVAGIYRNEKPPMVADVISDAIGLPVLANANRSLAAKVIA